MYVQLTPSEREVLECLAQGMSNREAASYLAKAWKTVDGQIASSMKKFRCRSSRQMMYQYALQRVAENLTPEQLKFVSVADLFRESPVIEKRDRAVLRISRLSRGNGE